MKAKRMMLLCLALCLLLCPMVAGYAQPASTAQADDSSAVEEPLQVREVSVKPVNPTPDSGEETDAAIPGAQQAGNTSSESPDVPGQGDERMKRLVGGGVLILIVLLALILIAIVKCRRRPISPESKVESTQDGKDSASSVQQGDIAASGERISAAVMSNRGRVRGNNEDNYFFNGAFMAKSEMDAGSSLCAQSEEALQLYAVCDGMGGIDAGEDASFAAVSQLHEWLNRTRTEPHTPDIEDEVAAISEQIWHDGQERDITTGSTIALAMVHGKHIDLLNAGDSRIYQYRKGKLTQLSEDQTEVQSLVELGLLTREQAMKHPRRHVLVSYLGMGSADQLAPHIVRDLALRVGDVYLLCSDGLTDMLDDEQIAETLAVCDSPEAVVRELVNAALENGGRDNVTVMVLSVPE